MKNYNKTKDIAKKCIKKAKCYKNFIHDVNIIIKEKISGEYGKVRMHDPDLWIK